MLVAYIPRQNGEYRRKDIFNWAGVMDKPESAGNAGDLVSPRTEFMDVLGKTTLIRVPLLSTEEF